jgi:hypothetical protein
MKNEHKPDDALAQLLTEEQREALYQAGIYNLHLEADGTLSGERTDTSWYPRTDYLGNITVKREDGRMTVHGDVLNSVEDVGKVI